MMELWPFTNFHDLNLDWIIKTIKTYTKKVDDLYNGGLYKFVDEILTAHPEWMVNWFVTPSMFNGVCDGVTDDRQAIQDMFNEAAASGKIAYIPRKMKCAWSGNVFIPSNVTFYINGEMDAVGESSSLCTFDTVTPTPSYTASHDIYIGGHGTVDMQGNTNTTSYGTFLRIGHAKNVTVEDITIKNCSQYHAIEIAGSYNTVIRNVNFKGLFENGATGYHEFIEIEHCDELFAAGAIPYDDTVSKKVDIENCYFGPSEEGGKCFTAIGSHSEPVDMFEDITIRNNIIDESWAYPLNFYTNMVNLIIENNEIRNRQGTLTNDANIWFNGGCSKVFIKNNILGDTNGRQIVLGVGAPNTDPLEDFTITGNDIGDYGMTGTDPVGILIRNPYTNLTIANNVFTSETATSLIPIHIPYAIYSGNPQPNILGNTFNCVDMDATNYTRYSRPQNKKLLFDSTGVSAEQAYTLLDDVAKYDLVEIRFEIPGYKQDTKLMDPGVLTSSELMNIVIPHAEAINPYPLIYRRINYSITGTTFTIQQNNNLIFKYTADGGGNITASTIKKERVSTTPTPTEAYMTVRQIYGFQRTNHINYI